jgi:hypothetical protein
MRSVGLAVAALLALAVSAMPAQADDGPIPDYCKACKPPLTYGGGPLMYTSGPTGLTVTPIFWEPAGSGYTFPETYEAIINGYIADVAAASGATDNVYSIATEYYDVSHGQPRYARYKIAAGTPIVDTRPLPAENGCKATGDFRVCVDDDQLQEELSAVLDAHHLPRDLSHFYPVFFPPGVETGDGAGGNSVSRFCAYHSNFGPPTRPVVYGNEPYEDYCGGGQAPNGLLAADEAISILSHELMESLTDPLWNWKGGWLDGAGWEVADECTWHYGEPLGSTDPDAPQTTEYNQVINGGRYYTQTQFSNYAYGHFGVGSGCQPSEDAARGGSGPPPVGVSRFYANASRHDLGPGHLSTDIFVQISDRDGFAISGDRISFTAYALAGNGECGTVKPRSAVTDGAGTVDVIYHATSSTVECAVVATDALTGSSVSSLLYQGELARLAPAGTITVPSTLKRGRRSTFVTGFVNGGSEPIDNARVELWIFSPNASAPIVRAGQIKLSVSRHGRGGPFVPVRLTGDTDSSIFGVVGGATGYRISAHHLNKLTYRITAARSVPLRRRPILQLQAFLTQVNPATGADGVLADSGLRNVTVRP